MAQINLLPWRTELRKQKQKDFFATTLFSVLVSAFIMLGIHTHFSGAIEYQNRRNQFLESQIRVLDQKIKEIQDLESKKKRLIARMEVIQELQVSRPEIVHLVDEIARSVPLGVQLQELTQTDKNLVINGSAESNGRVSNYLRNLESSAWLDEPILNIIQVKPNPKDAKAEVKAHQGNQFTVHVKQASSKSKVERP